jgi:tripartite-type tricarboxylate transporter receptor subunit TctC
MNHKFAALLACALLVRAAPAAQAAAETAAFPGRSIRLIVPFQAGSSSDVIARIVAGALGPRLGTQVVVENRVGGSTIVGTDLTPKLNPMVIRLAWLTPRPTPPPMR